MRRKYIIFSAVIFCLVHFGACKSDTPTTPNGDQGLELSGLITLNGQAFTNIDVYLSWGASQKTITGSNGNFSFINLPGGDYIITPSRNGYSFGPSNYEVNNQTRKDLNFTAQIATYGSKVGDIMANFTARDQNNQNVSLYGNFGKVILIDFTADWCTSCREKAETAEQFYQDYKDKGFMYILIVIEGNPSLWADTYGLTFPVLDDNNQDIYKLYGLGSIPLPHILDRNGTIRYKKEGWNKDEVVEIINKYL